MTITFTNPGEIDPRAFALMGLSAKETSSPIGQFGTGLKYSIAITLRLGGQITIWSGLTRYDFEVISSTFRSQPVAEVHYTTNGQNRQPLPFTLDYGKGWEPWQVIRELESNARDEGGISVNRKEQPALGETTIWLSGLPFVEAYSKLESIFISPRSLLSRDENLLGYANVHRREPHYGSRVYFRSVAVGELTKPALYTYDFHSGISLTEDRSVHYWISQQFPRMIVDTILHSTDPTYVETCLTASSDMFEGQLVFPDGDSYYSDNLRRATFHRVIRTYIESGRASLLNPSALRNYYQTFQLVDSLYETYDPTPREKALLVEAQMLVAPLFDGKLAPFKLVSSLPKDALGMVYANRIYISKACFGMGLETVVGTLYEEYCHFYLNLEDETRSFQNYLINTIARLLSELDFEKGSK